MGLKLAGLPGSPVEAGDLQGRTVAIDVPNLMYAFFAVQVGEPDPPAPVRASAVRAAVSGLRGRVADLAARGARSLLVLDGPPHPAKLEHLRARALARRTPALGPADYALAQEAARLLGVPVVQAPHDAEAQACWMAMRGVVDVVATTDWDALAMGAPRMLRNLSAHPDKTEGRRWTMVHAEEAFAHLRTDRKTLAGAAVLMGCDYFPGLSRVGPKRALALLRSAGGDLDEVLARTGLADDAREAARVAYRLMLDPPGVPPGPLRWRGEPATTQVRLAP